MMPKMMPTSTAAGMITAPIATQMVTHPITPTIDQVSWKFSASTACARTVWDVLPLASMATSGAIQPPKPLRMNMPAAPPKWAMSAHVLSSLLAQPGGGGAAARGGGGGAGGGCGGVVMGLTLTRGGDLWGEP